MVSEPMESKEPKMLTESTEPMMSPEPMVSMESRWIADVHMLVPQLTENNYARWSVEMKALLEEQDLWKIVEDGDTRPDTTGYTRSQQKTWRAPFTQNNIAILTIYYAIEGTCCSREIGDMRKAKEAWELLEKAYKVADSSNEVQPQKQGELATTKEDEKNVEGEPVREEVARVVESERDKDHAEPVVEKKNDAPSLTETGKEVGKSSKMKADGDEEEEIYPKAEEPVEEEKRKGIPNEGELEKEEAVEETPPRQPPEKVEEIDAKTSGNAGEMKNAVDDAMHTSLEEAYTHEVNEKVIETHEKVSEKGIEAVEETTMRDEEAMRRDNQERGVKGTTGAATTETLQLTNDEVGIQEAGEPIKVSPTNKHHAHEEKVREKDKEVKEWIKARDSLEAYMNDLKNRSNYKYKLAGKLEKDDIVTKPKQSEEKHPVAISMNLEYDKTRRKIEEELVKKHDEADTAIFNDEVTSLKDYVTGVKEKYDDIYYVAEEPNQRAKTIQEEKLEVNFLCCLVTGEYDEMAKMAKITKEIIDGKWRAATYDTRKRVKFKEYRETTWL